MLIADSISSVEQLEALLLLRRHREESFSEDELAKRLRSSEESIQLTLGALSSSGLAECDDDRRYRYACGSEERESVVGELEQLYKSRRTTIIQTIYNKP